MIEYVDVALMQYLKTLFPNLTLVWSPPEIARQRLAKIAQKNQAENPKPNPSNTVGIPGLAVFRTGVQRLIQSRPMGQHGFPNGQFPTVDDVPGDYNRILTIPTSALYTITAYTEALSDLNLIESTLSFIDIYKVVNFTIQSNSWTAPILWAGDITYAWDVDTNTAQILYYSLTKPLRIDSRWVQTLNVPPITEIQVAYNTLVNGEEITLETIDIVAGS